MVSIPHFSPIVYPICEEKMNAFLKSAHGQAASGAYWPGGDERMSRGKKLLLAAALALSAVLGVLAVLDNLGLLRPPAA